MTIRFGYYRILDTLTVARGLCNSRIPVKCEVDSVTVLTLRNVYLIYCTTIDEVYKVLYVVTLDKSKYYSKFHLCRV